MIRWYPPDDVLMAMAEALHDNDDICNANYHLPFDECAARPYDIHLAEAMLRDLHADGWQLSRDGQGTVEMGL